ncbi:pentapeptide repeat-containing protein [Streptomyces sp. HNM0575]|uniref:pentapeptide repeat-containing protein n=1 Tax=Streptomyces sp. HNM0575 TaxID=2716338 RepID=UPI00145D2DB5|nr:pentapeptide repeat-containing protein [Streptomyces sp. HNM0575]NLU71682.1 pentapeptide repeat-containing protein [Streptomyces sp. HNM0575]
MALAALVLFVVLPLGVWKGPYLLDGQYLKTESIGEGAGSAALVTGLRTAMVTCAASIGAGIALFYTASTYRLNRRGQVTDRFTKALERLDSENVYTRVGGILALEQIVRDAPGQATDAARVLGHFIRHMQPRASEARPDPDVQAALTALTRPESRTYVDPMERLDLSDLSLVGAKLYGADLTDADLTDANLSGAVLAHADLTGALLEGTNLTSAALLGVDFSNAKLVAARLENAFLAGATFTNAILRDVDLSGAMVVSEQLLLAHSLDGCRLPPKMERDPSVVARCR